MNRRRLLTNLGTATSIGLLSGCTAASDEQGSRDESSQVSSSDTDGGFDGRWGLPPCEENQDARVVIEDYGLEKGFGRARNLTSNNLLVSIMNTNGYIAEDTNDNNDIYVPFGETSSFRLTGYIKSVVTLTESKYEDSGTVDWLYLHDSLENEGCSLPQRGGSSSSNSGSSADITARSDDREEDRLKQDVKQAAEDADTYERGGGTETESQTTTTTQTGSFNGEITEVFQNEEKLRVKFRGRPTGDQSSVAYKVTVEDVSGDVTESKSGRLDLSNVVIFVHETLDFTFPEYNKKESYVIRLYIDGGKEDETRTE